MMGYRSGVWDDHLIKSIAFKRDLDLLQMRKGYMEELVFEGELGLVVKSQKVVSKEDR